MAQYAKLSDVPGILSVQSECLLQKKRTISKARLESSGFIVYPVSKKDLARCIRGRKNHVVLVAKEKGKVAGYALSYDLPSYDKEWISKIEVPARMRAFFRKRRILFWRHIARRGGSGGKGAELAKKMLSIASSRGYAAIVGEILLKPYNNKRSERFTSFYGFARVGKIRHGKYLWRIWMKKL